MKVISSLKNNIEIRIIPTDTFEELSSNHAKAIFDSSQYFFRPRDFYTEEESNKIKILKQNLGQPFRLNLGAFHNDELIGWSWGLQESTETFYMLNSAVIPSFRKQGIYRANDTGGFDSMLKQNENRPTKQTI